jgi:hypothetical protein
MQEEREMGGLRKDALIHPWDPKWVYNFGDLEAKVGPNEFRN